MTGITITDLLPGSYAAVYLASGSGIAVTNEAMEEISDIENGNPRYTVYQITDEDKQALDISTVPTFEKQVHGAGDWTSLTSNIREIQYPGGRVVLTTALNSDDLVRCATGKYLTKSRIWAALSTKISDKSIMKDVTPLGSLGKKNYPVIDEFDIGLDVFANNECAQLVANDLTLTHQPGGTAGNAISYEVLNPGGLNTLSVTVTASKISVNLGHSGSAIISTNQNVVDAVNADPSVIRLGVVAQCEMTDAASLAAAFSEDNLAGGVDPIAYADKKGSLLMPVMYADEDNNIRWEGYAYLSEINSDLTPDDIIKQSLTLSTFGKVYFRPR